MGGGKGSTVWFGGYRANVAWSSWGFVGRVFQASSCILCAGLYIASFLGLQIYPDFLGTVLIAPHESVQCVRHI